MKNKFFFLFVFLFGLINMTAAQHFKKDGTPDMRYKENKKHTNYTSGKKSLYTTGHSRTRSNYGLKRDSHGRIKRSQSARHAFMKQTGYPRGRPGYVIDHIVPLKKGGCDCPSNMQWQSVQAAKEKDRWER